MRGLSDSARKGLMVAQGIAMLVVGLMLVFLRATMTFDLFTLLGSILSVLLIAASLLFVAVTDVLSSIGLDRGRAPHLRRLLAATAIAAFAGVFVILYGPVTTRPACYLFAGYSLILSIGKAHLAKHWAGTRQAQAVIWMLAAIALVFSGVLVWAATFAADERSTLSVIAGYAIFMGLQMLLTMFAVRRLAARPAANPQAA
jgi:hypothetical protein